MNLADRITRRLLMEPPLIHHHFLGHVPETARIAALEAEDSAIDPLDTHPRIAIARRALDLGDPDLDDLRAVGWEQK